MPWKSYIQQILSQKYQQPVIINNISAVSGGSINETFTISTNTGKFFVKKNSASLYPEMFEKEARGLQILSGKSILKVPEVIATGQSENATFLILEQIESGNKRSDFWNHFAEGLAQLHKNSAAHFGLDHDNYIGSLHQSNAKHNDWIDFFRTERLEKQVKLARDNGRMGKTVVSTFENFYRKLPDIFPKEPPALIHGDLWGGNYMIHKNGEATIIDPAVYYGHREMDLAMSQLFGGFDNELYEAYHRFFPLEKGWQRRMDYCNLYPLMVHVNLFGGGYLNSVQSILRKF
ncbi:fructosamine kinase family protein [bacterium]|nr:fructosamine kinase family protein [bacterium]